MDPFFAQSTLAIFCDVLEPSTRASVMSATRAAAARKAEAYLQQTGIGDKANSGPEA